MAQTDTPTFVTGYKLPITFAATTDAFLRCYLDSSGNAAIAAATNKAIGVSWTGAPAFSGGSSVGNLWLAHQTGTIIMKANAAISIGGYVYAAASGKVAPTGTIPEGKAKTAASADGDLIEVIPMSALAGGGGIFAQSYYFTGTPAATDQVIFVAPRACRLLQAEEVHSVAAGGASVIQLVKDSTTSAPGAGSDLLSNNSSTGFDLNGTANTVQAATLLTTAGLQDFAIGDRLAVDFANAIQSSAGVCITAVFQWL